MKITTIKGRIFKYNIIVIILLITLTTVIFNVAVKLYIEEDVLNQLNKIASNTEHAALKHGPDFFPDHKGMPPPPKPDKNKDIFGFYFMLDRTLKESLTVLNADYVLLDKNKEIINPFPKETFTPPTELISKITNEINNSKGLFKEFYIKFNLSSTEYISIIKPVSDKNSFGLGWIIIYSSLEKVNQLQMIINIILFAILIFSALIIVIFSSRLAKKISAPFSTLNTHIKSIAERNFGEKIHMPVDDELQEFVNNINVMSEKLEIYDKAQKTFLQNASHEFRTPLMSIQSYAEGIKYDVVDIATATAIIIDESKRMTSLVEDLLYLSRLDSIEESYNYTNLAFNKFMNICIDRVNAIAIKNNIKIIMNDINEKVQLYADEEKLSRAITNIISNCIRYAESNIEINLKIFNSKIEIIIHDDGPGFQAIDLPNIFERFYKGKKGNFGLGLSISKSIIEKHKGKTTAKNSESGALFIIELPIIEFD